MIGLTSLLDALPALVSSVDTALNYRFANAAHRTWFGIDPAVLVGRPVWTVITPALAPKLAPLVHRALAGEAGDLEIELPPQFSVRFARVMVTPERDADGAVSGLAFLVTDLSRQRALAQKLTHSETMFNDAFQAAVVGKALVSMDGVITRANPAFAGMLGYRTDELEGKAFGEITYPDDVVSDMEQFEALKTGKIGGYKLEKRYIHRNGHPVAAMLSVAMVRGEADGTPPFFVSQIVDIRERKSAEQRLRERNAQLTLALDVLEGGVWQFDIATRQITASDGLTRLLGGDPERPLTARDLCKAIHPEDRSLVNLTALVNGRTQRASATFRIVDPNGRQRWVRCRRQLMSDDEGRPSSVLGVIVDVSEDHLNELRLEREATTDPLTGLLNRRGFDAGLERVLERPGSEGAPALLLIDLDRFKVINDTMGHPAGDSVLREVARRIGGQVRATDSIARLGGDEFAVLLPRTDRAAAEQAGARIVAALAEPHRVGMGMARATASIGIALADGMDTPQSLFERADEVLYAVKRGGRGTWRLAA